MFVFAEVMFKEGGFLWGERLRACLKPVTLLPNLWEAPICPR